MAAIFPPIPRFIFTVCEPISMVAGFLAAIVSPASFVADQLPNTPLHALTPNEYIIALQLGNVYLLIGFIGIAVLYTTTSAQVARRYLLVLLLGDIGHLAVTYHVMGRESFFDVTNWNAMAWGNICFTGALFLARVAYLLGFLGEDREPGKKAKAQ
ncbi:hypothetical protein FGG08_001963 [Glutinoglossum americanum]|uniref:DUF7704 domain-containing protein n=1 Tax=Glutinoglossum americanum TaxID=1670608 RepID=A0A9P8L5Y5_9PEZI|nr:hypothetical protein FGG08_001963 [Glutinoglossum americanum]